MLFGVPQGTVLGPIHFLLYTAELFDVVAECGSTAHSYTPASDHSDTMGRPDKQQTPEAAGCWEHLCIAAIDNITAQSLRDLAVPFTKVVNDCPPRLISDHSTCCTQPILHVL